jgi:hypothetical protein
MKVCRLSALRLSKERWETEPPESRDCGFLDIKAIRKTDNHCSGSGEGSNNKNTYELLELSQVQM